MILSTSRVLLANGSLTQLSNLKPGDRVIDGRGNIETVEGVSTRTSRSSDFSTLKYVTINNVLTIDTNQCICSGNNIFYAVDQRTQYWTGRNYITSNYEMVRENIWGVYIQDIQLLTANTVVMGSNSSNVTITSINQYTPSNTDVFYTHKITGSGTYVVEGICVDAWADSTTFNYSTWQSISNTDPIIIIQRIADSNIRFINKSQLSNVSYNYLVWSSNTNSFVNSSISNSVSNTA